MCCIIPCVKALQRRYGQEEDTRAALTLAVTEVIRWLTIVLPLYLSIWRCADIIGPNLETNLTYPVMIPQIQGNVLQFWVFVTAVILGISLFIYMPLKLAYVRFFINFRNVYGWRPSIVIYMIFCALPCFTLVVYGIKITERDLVTMDKATAVVLQLVVMGLTMTEWMAKFREEEFTYDLIGAMSTDFFFAYDVIEFIMMSAYESHIYDSGWIYVTFVFGFIAMFKYVPATPIVFTENEKTGAPTGAVISILAQILFNDIPFIIVRVATMVAFGFDKYISDLIHPMKNIALIFFGTTQLFIIWKNMKLRRQQAKPRFRENRCCRRPLSIHVTANGGTNERVVGNAVDDCGCDVENQGHHQDNCVSCGFSDQLENFAFVPDKTVNTLPKSPTKETSVKRKSKLDENEEKQKPADKSANEEENQTSAERSPSPKAKITFHK